MILKFYREPALISPHCRDKLQQLQHEFPDVQMVSMETELCFYVDINTDASELSAEQLGRLRWILSIPFQEEQLSRDSFLSKRSREKNTIIEIGPRFNFSTPFSTNAVGICQSIDLKQVQRIECSIRYLIYTDHPSMLIPKHLEDMIADRLHDRMTQMRYEEPIDSFYFEIKPEPWYQVDVLGQGRPALEKVSQQLGLAFDDWDLNFYTEMFQHRLKRNPSSVECFDLAQSNSEHSRHWFFKGHLVVDGLSQDQTLFDMVIETQRYTNTNNIIKFSDNSSGILGFECMVLKPSATNTCSQFIKSPVNRDIIFTAETHNFPTGVAPFPGASTGTGGRIRDVQAAGRGGHVVAGTAGYCFGNLHIPHYKLPWEDEFAEYPRNLASPLRVAIEASNGASDYGNKFGEPVIAGFARSFGMRLPGGERKEYVKPVMFSGGIGTIEHAQIKKCKPLKGMEVAKLGGPVYRIGVGGGAASSVKVHGDNAEELDYGAVQRGDAEMEQKLNRVIRGCLEQEGENPIASIHDQGAGGNGNVLKELVEPAGAVVYTDHFQLGDPTISTLECWGAEYQESNAILVIPEKREVLEQICVREKCPISFVGEITGDGNMVLVEGSRESAGHVENGTSVTHPVNLDLDCVLGKMPQKTFYLDRVAPLSVRDGALVANVSVGAALDRVLRLPAVASKRYLTNKVDRSVTGLVAQQQCVGPVQTPLADVAVVAHSYFETVGSATAIGEQPIKGLVCPKVGARMSVVEALTNLMFANISCLQDVKCSANWMWPAKLPGEGAALFDACKAMSDIMAELGVAVDGGKDSLSMAARVGNKTIKAPGTLVISAYAPCTDVTKTVTPDFKCENRRTTALYVKVEKGRFRLGGTAFAQVFNHFGEDAPDLEHSKIFKECFKLTQKLIGAGKIKAGHDVSDGGVLVALLEMAFAGNCGLEANFKTKGDVNRVRTLFNEEVGWILEVEEDEVATIIAEYVLMGAECDVVAIPGPVGCDAKVGIRINNEMVFTENMATLRDIWEETSFRLERLQTTMFCVQEEQDSIRSRRNPPYKLTFDPDEAPRLVKRTRGPKVCVLREEGTNGDREMAAALFMAGFEVWDVHMSDLMSHQVDLNQFQGLVFPGGFSYADVLGAAKGWAAELMFDKELYAQLETFKNRPDTFTLGVCNGCQLMAILGLVAPSETLRPASVAPSGQTTQGVTLAINISGRYESRFTTVKIEKSPAIMFKHMEDSVLGVWISHGEGRFEFKNSRTYEGIRSRKLVPLSYVDDKGSATTKYPFNPNGSPGGLAGLCSEDGRHLAIMPHPERTFLPWQWAWMPNNMKNKVKTSPWMRMFDNAYEWCIENQVPS